MFANKADHKVQVMQIALIILWIFAIVSSWMISSILVANLTEPLTIVMQMTTEERKRANVAKQKRHLEKNLDKVNAGRRKRYAAKKKGSRNKSPP